MKVTYGRSFGCPVIRMCNEIYFLIQLIKGSIFFSSGNKVSNLSAIIEIPENTNSGKTLPQPTNNISFAMRSNFFKQNVLQTSFD